MLVQFHAFHTRGVYANVNSFINEIQQGLEQRVAPRIKHRLSEVADSARLDVQFGTSIETFQDGIFVYISPKGPDLKKWIWISGGTKPHPITVNKTSTFRPWPHQMYKPALKLNRYAPVTSPHFPLAGGGPGKRLAPTAYRKTVMHTGVTPRNFEWHVVQELYQDDLLRRDIENTLRRAVRRAQREGY